MVIDPGPGSMQAMATKNNTLHILVLLAVLATISACERLDAIPYTPTQTPATWLQIQPYAEIEIASRKVIVVQPSTSFIVYLLGCMEIAVGWCFLATRRGEQSRLWWGIALLSTGFGALLAGTSYEAFSYVIKCAGRNTCVWTSWWEVWYLVLSFWSIAATMLAVACSSAVGRLRRTLCVYAVLTAVLYSTAAIVGALTPVRLLVSFEFFLAVATPSTFAFLVINGWRYARYRQALDLACLGAWIWLDITIAAYFLYLGSGVGATLWERGIWFTENDVLHIGLIIWTIYIAAILAPRVRDASAPAPW